MHGNHWIYRTYRAHGGACRALNTLSELDTMGLRNEVHASNALDTWNELFVHALVLAL